MTLEITGQLIGMARTSEGASLMLSTERNGTINKLSMSLLPHWVQPGSYLRALVVVAGAPQAGMTIGLPDLLVVAVASASDVAVLERREQSARQTARTSPQSRSFPKASGPLPRRAAASAASPPGTSRPWLDARTAQLSRSLSSDARAVYEPYRYTSGAAIGVSERDVDAITTDTAVFRTLDVDPRLVIALILAESSFRPG